MDANDMHSLGLAGMPPRNLMGQRPEPAKRPKELNIEVAADRGSRFPSNRARPCQAYDFDAFTRRHLYFFQHHCTIMAKAPLSTSNRRPRLESRFPRASNRSTAASKTSRRRTGDELLNGEIFYTLKGRATKLIDWH